MSVKLGNPLKITEADREEIRTIGRLLHKHRDRVAITSAGCTFGVDGVIYCSQDDGIVVTAKLIGASLPLNGEYEE